MRPAGRSLPEYRKIRERYQLVDIVADADLCAEVTLQPVRRLGVDAAVMFADIMLPLEGMGVDFQLVEEVGPVIADPVRTPADVARLRTPSPEESVPQVLAAVRRVAAESPVPVICFSGAPFTLASYAIEGRPSRDFKLTKAFMYREPEAFDLLLEKLGTVAADYLAAQVAAGAQALQVFDSWVGVLAPEDYAARVLPHTRRLFAATARLGVPRIHFGTGTAGLLELIADAGPDVVSLDWRVCLDAGWARLGGRPLERSTRAQAAALAERTELPTFVGMMHAPPFIAEGAGAASEAGIRRLIGLPLAPHFAAMSLGQYEADLQKAWPGELVFIPGFHAHPAFIETIAGVLREALAGFPADHVFFTAHSLPERILREGDGYRDRHLGSCALVAAGVVLPPWSFAFQSASRTGEPWLGPDLLEGLAESGTQRTLVCPIGFVADHLA